jgi:hypothetical protein
VGILKTRNEGLTQNDANADCVLIDETDDLFGIDDEAVRGAVDELLLDFKV